MQGWNNGVVVNVRVSGQLSYTPAYQKPDGTLVQQKVRIPVAQNGYKSPKTGIASVDFYTLTVWGTLADICCKRCTQGMSLTAGYRLNSYQANRYFEGTMLLLPNGQPLLEDKIGLEVQRRELHFGQEAAGLIAEEVRTGKRPALWYLQGHEDENVWKAIYTKRNTLRYNGIEPLFGYAKVFLPKSGKVILNPEEYRKTAQANVLAALPAQVSAVLTPPLAGVQAGMTTTTTPVTSPAAAVLSDQSVFGNGGFVQKPVAAVAAGAGRLSF